MPEFNHLRSNEIRHEEEFARSESFINWVEGELSNYPGSFISNASRDGYLNDEYQIYADSIDAFFVLIDNYASDNYIGRDGENEGVIVTFSHNEKFYNASIWDSYDGWFCLIKRAEDIPERTNVTTFKEIVSGQKTERAKEIDSKLNEVKKIMQNVLEDNSIAKLYINNYIVKLLQITKKPRIYQQILNQITE